MTSVFSEVNINNRTPGDSSSLPEFCVYSELLVALVGDDCVAPHLGQRGRLVGLGV